MAKNPKVNINVGAKNYVSFSQRLKTRQRSAKCGKYLKQWTAKRAVFPARTGAR